LHNLDNPIWRDTVLDPDDPIRSLDDPTTNEKHLDLREKMATDRIRTVLEERTAVLPDQVRILVLSLTPGAGKSAFCNTARAVFNGRFSEESAHGEDSEAIHEARAVTEECASFPLFVQPKELSERVRLTDTPGALQHGASGAFSISPAALQAAGSVLQSNVRSKIRRMEGMVGVAGGAGALAGAGLGTVELSPMAALGVADGGGHHCCCLLIDGAALACGWLERLDATAAALGAALKAIKTVMDPVILVTKVDQLKAADPEFDFSNWFAPLLAEQTAKAMGFDTVGGAASAASRAARMLTERMHPIVNIVDLDDFGRRREASAGGEEWSTVQQLHERAMQALLHEASRFWQQHFAPQHHPNTAGIIVRSNIPDVEPEFVRPVSWAARMCKSITTSIRAASSGANAGGSDATANPLVDVVQQPGVMGQGSDSSITATIVDAVEPAAFGPGIGPTWAGVALGKCILTCVATQERVYRERRTVQEQRARRREIRKLLKREVELKDVTLVLAPTTLAVFKASATPADLEAGVEGGVCHHMLSLAPRAVANGAGAAAVDVHVVRPAAGATGPVEMQLRGWSTTNDTDGDSGVQQETDTVVLQMPSLREALQVGARPCAQSQVLNFLRRALTDLLFCMCPLLS